MAPLILIVVVVGALVFILPQLMAGIKEGWGYIEEKGGEGYEYIKEKGEE